MGKMIFCTCAFASPLFFVTFCEERERERALKRLHDFIFDKRTRDKNNRKYDASYDVSTCLCSKPVFYARNSL